MIFGEMCVLSLVYIYVAVCRFCAVRCVIIISFSLLFSIYSTYVFLTFFLCFSSFVCLFSILCVLCFCVVLWIVSYFVCSCLSPIFLQVYRPLPPGGNPITVNIIIKYPHLEPQLFIECNLYRWSWYLETQWRLRWLSFIVLNDADSISPQPASSSRIIVERWNVKGVGGNWGKARQASVELDSGARLETGTSSCIFSASRLPKGHTCLKVARLFPCALLVRAAFISAGTILFAEWCTLSVYNVTRFLFQGRSYVVVTEIFMIFTPHQILLGDQIEMNEMGGACGTYRGEDRCI
jgi:hypothetical protein